MYSDWVLWLLLLAAFVWLLGLSFIVFKNKSFLNTLFPKSGERDIRKKFEEVLNDLGDFKGDLGEIRLKLSELERDGLGHIQKVELLRYNPFDDTGGDQSFSITLLDNGGNGFVITSLHGRSGTRIFAKGLNRGKADKHQLSKEEEEVVKRALKK